MKFRFPRWPTLLAAGLVLTLAGQASALYLVDLYGASPLPAVTAEDHGWAKGTLELVNHPTRRQGWSPFFSECPNDVEHFGYRLRNMDDVNGLLDTLGRVDAKVSVLLSLEREYRWDREATEGFEAHFVLGSQKRMDEWWSRLPDGKFGVHTYPKPPTALAPQLTLYVGSGKIDMRRLRVPPQLPVAALINPEARTQPELAVLARQVDAFVAARKSAP